MIVKSVILNRTDYENPSDKIAVNFCQVCSAKVWGISTCSETSQSENELYSVLNITSIYAEDGEEWKNNLKTSQGNKNRASTNF